MLYACCCYLLCVVNRLGDEPLPCISLEVFPNERYQIQDLSGSIVDLFTCHLQLHLLQSQNFHKYGEYQMSL